MKSGPSRGTGTDILEERLVPDLMREFEGRRSAGEVRACARAVLATYEDAPVRSFILPLAHRHTRDCLRTERCEFLQA